MMAPSFISADGETRTPKDEPHAPQACAYTNSATSARFDLFKQLEVYFARFVTIAVTRIKRQLPPPMDLDFAKHRQYMAEAIGLAQAAGAAGEVPVGAIVVNGKEEVIARGVNRRQRDRDPTAHAEILALRAAARVLQSWYLTDCTLYVTLEPCPMCAGAIIAARLGLLVYGASEPKTGSIRSVINLPDSPASNHCLPVVAGILEDTCRQQLQDWFDRTLRNS
jgi:tRNA(adenine34) deaminase